jgi:hypothetical protein
MAPGTRSGSGDDCIVDADCTVAGEVCQQSNNVLFYPADLCGDGAGGVYLLSNDGAVTDPSPSSTNAERSEVVMRLTLDSRGNTTSRALIYRTIVRGAAPTTSPVLLMFLVTGYSELCAVSRRRTSTPSTKGLREGGVVSKAHAAGDNVQLDGRIGKQRLVRRQSLPDHWGS